ncbi:MAG: glutamate--tRNA ligase [Hyphomicrobiales bacterium]|nr:glutamate--tRNA ligase [Hyphomicrobiales bacterium]
MTTITRFAPSPTGFLHIGGARTALFNWLLARHYGGTFRLRVEDTDRKRSTQEAIDAILNGMRWLGLDWDEEVFFQSQAETRHREIAEQLLAEGKAYRCYCTPEELAEMRQQAEAAGKPFRYDGRWRDRDPADAPEGIRPAIRIKSPTEGETIIEDSVQGKITVPNHEQDDMVILRSDGTPTYMLAVVVDDHDMGITHIVRGVDHLTNATRQMMLYQALGWQAPVFAHIPLIHGQDGAKLSKRHGALGVEAYRDMGLLPEAVRNYLLRLGWSHGDDEIISTEQAIKWFDLKGVGKSPSRFDMAKLENLNAHYLRQMEDAALADAITPILKEVHGLEVDNTGKERLTQGMPDLKTRAKTLLELAENAAFYVRTPPLPQTDKAEKAILEHQKLLKAVIAVLDHHKDWQRDALHDAMAQLAEAEGLKLGSIAMPLRAALTGSHVSPSVFDIMAVLGREETLARLKAVG